MDFGILQMDRTNFSVVPTLAPPLRSVILTDRTRPAQAIDTVATGGPVSRQFRAPLPVLGTERLRRFPLQPLQFLHTVGGEVAVCRGVRVKTLVTNPFHPFEPARFGTTASRFRQRVVATWPDGGNVQRGVCQIKLNCLSNEHYSVKSYVIKMFILVE